MGNQTMCDFALEYAKQGFAVFPLEYKGKVPVISGGFKNATTEVPQIKAWWEQYPHANIGIATGKMSGNIFVVDLDIDEDKGINGYDTLRDWQRDHGDLPDTAMALTGRGGNHLYFRSDRPVKSRTNILAGVDIRGEGGYVVAPPSLHKNGNRYEWEQEIDDYGIATADRFVYKFLDHGTEAAVKPFSLKEQIGSGERNSTMYKLACSLQAKGLSDETILLAVKAENQFRCDPPLEMEELEKTVQSALSKEKGQLSVPSVTQSRPKQYITLKMGPPNKDGERKVLQSIENVCTVLREDELLYNKIRLNSLSYSPYLCGKPPWSNKPEYREWTDTDDSNLICYIEENYGLKSETKILRALDIVMGENAFNPVIQQLLALPPWDGRPYIENLLPDFLGVEKNEYTTACMRIFMLGAIERAYHPGCKFDYMPVLIGEQGVGKSTFLRYLAMNDSWYDDNFNTVEGDKATERLRGMWFVEMAELLAVKRQKEIESIKAFITSTMDTYRPPYGRRTVQRPRACVFAGTTNNPHFLTDTTGNRRYLPIQTRKSHVKKSLFSDRNQVVLEFEAAWSEALHIYKNEHPALVLPRELQKEALRMQSKYIEEDVRVGVVQSWLDDCQYDRVCVMLIWEQALKNDKKPTKRDSNEIHDIMRNSIKGWKEVGRVNSKTHGKQICYERDIKDGFYEVEGTDTQMELLK